MHITCRSPFTPHLLRLLYSALHCSAVPFCAVAPAFYPLCLTVACLSVHPSLPSLPSPPLPSPASLPAAVVELDVSAALRALGRVRRSFDDNVEARAEHEGEPVKWMPSEAQLHDATIDLRKSHTQHAQTDTQHSQPASALQRSTLYSVHQTSNQRACKASQLPVVSLPVLSCPVLSCPVLSCLSIPAPASSASLCSALLSGGVLSVLSSLLLHENADIGNAAVSVCGELLDDDTLRQLPDAQLVVQQMVKPQE